MNFRNKMSKVENILNNKGIRITPMRQLVLEYFLDLQSSTGLSDLEEIFPKGDRITIYRTLRTFEENGIIHKIESGASEIKYALCLEHCDDKIHIDRHPHFHCIKCLKVSCLYQVNIPDFQLPQGYQIQEMNMTIKGICEYCTR